MFSIFTTDTGKLIVRAVDIRRLQDGKTGCILGWEEAGESHICTIVGTAEENLNRLKQEETDALLAAEKLRQRQASGYPPDPIQRGKQALRMVTK